MITMRLGSWVDYWGNPVEDVACFVSSSRGFWYNRVLNMVVIF